MPCNCDYMDPHEWEIEASKVYALLDELETGLRPDPKIYGNGFDKRVYGKLNKKSMDSLVAELCSKLKNKTSADLFQYSLELQLWHRDHIEADKKA